MAFSREHEIWAGESVTQGRCSTLCSNACLDPPHRSAKNRGSVSGYSPKTARMVM